MSLEGFIEYKRREFCNDVKCPVQMELNNLKNKPDEYERIRQTCNTACKYTTGQFHHWLIEKGYLILKPIKRKV
jgi:predicted metal-binding transcription factor (methanogenesis marker protein 9)